ncbi:S8/S53 family peptidase [Dactylosporangium vinaceum]|uniref:S8/S53 family peptidase n=1 Tax=Dactylosporangium vinaceum TaxID=53362 RepID=A0ABV5M3S1_9ACTN|nr:S8/S53 family peptidase [Dactylosporangium vinaceum]UAB94473.1 S8/S53 family peptidase [Dactylosporangium vinaceum]
MVVNREDSWPRSANARTPAEAQTAMVLEEYGDYLEPGPPDWRESGGIRHFVRRGFVLVHDGYADRAHEMLVAAGIRGERATERAAALLPGGRRRPEEPVDGDVRYGVRYLRVGPERTVPEALRVLHEGLHDGGGRRLHDPLGPDIASAEHLLHLADHSGVCPADEPGFVPPLSPPDPPIVADRSAGQGIRIVVIDTGLDPAVSAPWLAGVTGDPDPGVAGGVINRYAGHGTFIAGVIRTVAPAAEVIVRAGLPGVLFQTGRAATNPPGTVFERDLVSALERCLVQDSPDIISLSAGTYSDTPGGPMLLNAFNDRVLHRYKGVVLVAAAGNDAARTPFWPAAARGVVGVGALAANRRDRARFSNLGAWVDVYAPGDQLINAFPTGVYTYTEPPRRGATQRFEGLARWSGTSFSTPVVAGLIAARMSRTGENGPDAAAALIARARKDAIPGVGAILVPA